MSDVGLFKKRRGDAQVDMNERSPQLGVKYKDLAVLGQLMNAGADLTQPRHVIFYSYAPSEEVGRTMAEEAQAAGYGAEVREPLAQLPDQWSVVCEITAVTSPDFVREADDFFQGIADRHGADYDGWEASL